MALDDHAVFVYCDGAAETEFPYRLGDLVNPFLRMQLCVVFVGDELLNQEHLYLEF